MIKTCLKNRKTVKQTCQYGSFTFVQHQGQNKKKSPQKNLNSLLNLHFKAPQALGPFRVDRACQKIPACKIWWAFVQYTSSYGQNTSKFLFIFCYFLYFEVYPSSTPQIPLPTIVKSFQDILFGHKNDIEHILYGYISRKHEFRRRTFSQFL